MNTEKIVKEINKLRLENKGKWYYYTKTTDSGVSIELEAFATWVKIFKINGKKYSFSMGMKVKEFKKMLADILNDY